MWSLSDTSSLVGRALKEVETFMSPSPGWGRERAGSRAAFSHLLPSPWDPAGALITSYTER